MNKRRLIITLAIVEALILAIAIFFWNEARKEITVMCSNFSIGTTEEQVLTQLQTLSLSDYHQDSSLETHSISIESWMTPGMFQCEIELDENGRVISSELK